MTFPKTLKIGAHTVKIDCSEKLDQMWGQWEADKNLIKISSDLTGTQKEVTLFHEILHALNSQWMDNVDRHYILESLAQQIYQVLKDNRLLK